MTDSFCGTPEYLAPEIYAQRKTGHNYLVDYWSLGVLIYEMLGGNNPFKKKGLSAYDKMQLILKKDVVMIPHFSPAATSLLKGLMNRNPQRRLGSKGVSQLKEHIFFEGIDWEKLEKR